MSMFDCSEIRVRTGVVVSARHPIRGTLYWYYSDESSVGGPDFYGITDKIGRALLLDADWRTSASFSIYGDHIRTVLRNSDEFGDGWDDSTDQSRDEFHEWLRTTDWVDQPAPPRMEQLVDHGYFCGWEDCHVSIDHLSNPQDSFQLALQARLLWMEVQSLDRLGFWEESREIKQRAFERARSLAVNEVFHSSRYGLSTPTMLKDAPELTREYTDFFQYWIAVKAHTDASDAAFA